MASRPAMNSKTIKGRTFQVSANTTRSISIDVQKKIRGRYEARGTGQSTRDTACLSDGFPTIRPLAGGIARDLYHTSYALHASTTLSPSPAGVCERLSTL